MTHAVIVASVRRPEMISGLMDVIAGQTRRAEQVILSVVDPARDLPLEVPTWATVVVGRPGLTVQRNTGIRALRNDVELVTFLDDDAHLSPTYLEDVYNFSTLNAAVVLFSGRVVYDGATSPYIDRNNASAILRSSTRDESTSVWPRAYGCNMNVQASVLAVEQFDERLPAYGWLEDRDFSVRCARRGKVLRYNGATLVHLGTPTGRVSGSALGYSQVANPHYLGRKGVLNAKEVLWFVARAVLANLVGVLRRDKMVDRTGRLAGNARALRDTLKKTVDPGKAIAEK